MLQGHLQIFAKFGEFKDTWGDFFKIFFKSLFANLTNNFRKSCTSISFFSIPLSSKNCHKNIIKSNNSLLFNCEENYVNNKNKADVSVCDHIVLLNSKLEQKLLIK